MTISVSSTASDYYSIQNSGALGYEAASSAAEVIDTQRRPLGHQAPAWLKEVAYELLEISNRGTNWDGWDSPAPSMVAIESLFGLLLRSAWLRTVRPHVSGTSVGGASAEFSSPKVEMLLEVEKDSSA